FINQTTTVRAAAFKTAFLSTNVDTETYIFTSDVITQSPTGAAPNIGGTQWPTGPLAPRGQIVDYGMDPDIVNNPAYSGTIESDLKQIPSFSIVMNINDLFSSQTGIFANADQDGKTWERPASIELICPPGNTAFVCTESGGDGFQIDAGIRIRGGYSRQPSNPKHAFRFFFRDEYGDGKLNFPMFGPDAAQEFDSFDLRTFQNYSWSFDPNGGIGIFMRDVLSRDAQLAMGQPGERGDYYHLYINGQYWGLFNSDERPEADYAASYFGGTPADYDVIKVTDGYNIFATDGNMAGWSDYWNQVVALKAIADGAGDTNAGYLRLQGKNPDGTRNPAYPVYLDVDNLIDYMLVIFYGGNLDAPLSNFLGNTSPNNFFAIWNRNGNEGFKYFVHDAEHTLLNVNENRTGPWYIQSGSGVLPLNKSNPQSIFEILELNPEFRVRVADRIHKWMFNDGVLTQAKFTALFNARKAEIDRAVVGESARWGDSKSATPYTRDGTWLNAVNNVLNNYLPSRTGIVLSQLQADNLYLPTPPPDFNQYNTTINSGFSLTMTNPGGQGTIYYTTNGIDPRLFGGGLAGAAQVYSAPIVLNQTTTVLARVRLADGTWSPMTESTYKLNLSALRVTEINYNPVVPPGSTYTSQDYEFIELQNTGIAPINPGGATFTNGITYTFPSMTIAGGSRILLVKNIAAFESLYGTGLNVVGTFTGALNDAGEEITLAQGNSTVFDFTYNDSWYPITDGGGYTLTVLNATQAPALFSTAA
ncbi:MAG TPA: CotH kinase family protein, partial [Tepidisphaeraceae bacterium]|nr:CotH kinase family protein [Tepidisphaeraceae bacterium]